MRVPIVADLGHASISAEEEIVYSTPKLVKQLLESDVGQDSALFLGTLCYPWMCTCAMPVIDPFVG
eukprot:1824264-Rhodomonas_salina.1